MFFWIQLKTSLLFLLCLSFGVSSRNVATITQRCEYYNSTLCPESKPECFEVQECEQAEPEKRNHCFVLWQNDSLGKPYIQLKGCFLNNIGCYDQPRCVEKHEKPKKSLMFCCCEGDMCNQNFSWKPDPSPSPPSGSLSAGTTSTVVQNKESSTTESQPTSISLPPLPPRRFKVSLPETEETQFLTTTELQRLVLLEQLKLTPLQIEKEKLFINRLKSTDTSVTEEQISYTVERTGTSVTEEQISYTVEPRLSIVMSGRGGTIIQKRRIIRSANSYPTQIRKN